MSKKTYSIQNGKEVKQIEPLFNKLPYSQLNSNISTLHDPYDIKHIHGLRNRLFKTFNTFATILENSLLPPVLKITKKVQIKIKECDQQSNTNYIHKFNSMYYEIKKESINENLHLQKSKTNSLLRKSFQMKLVQCYKLAINATALCSKTLEANIYNPIQSKLKTLIKLISALSLTTGIYLYGALSKKKEKESFDLVQRCKGITRMLDEYGYKDTENKTHNNNTLNELAKKALAKPKNHFSNSKHLSMYSHTKPKFGSIYAQGFSKKSLNSTSNQDIEEKHLCNSKIINGKPLLLKNDINFSSGNKLFNYNIDNIKTVVQEHPIEKVLDINETNNTQVHKKIENNMFKNYTEEVTNLPISSKTLKFNKSKTPNNVKLYIVKENVWRKFPIKNVCLSQNGCLILNINPEQVRNNYLYKRQFRELSLTTESQVNTLSNITELIMEDLINEVLSKIDYGAIVNKIIRMELLE